MPFAEAWVDLETVIQSEVSQKEENKYRLILLHVNLEKWYRWTYLQSRNRDTDVENKLTDTKGGREDGMNWEISAYMAEDHAKHLLYFF